jgi:tetratricopeptide (TPR) repeat protein
MRAAIPIAPLLRLARAPRLQLAAALLGALALGCGPALDAQLDEAQALVVAGQPGAALPLLEGVVRRRPNDGAANLLLGQVLLQTGQTRPAVPPLTRALESEPHAVPAGLLLASAYLSEGRPDEALPVVERVLASHPGNAAALRIRATSHLQLGQADQAVLDAQRILELAPEDPQGPVLLGAALTRLGRLDEAERVLSELERKARDAESPASHARACAALAAFLAAGRQDSARGDRAWRQCLEQHPADPGVLQGAAAFFDQRGDAESSLAAFRRAVEAAPQALGIRVSLARRLAASGSPAEGEALLLGAAEGDGGWGAWQALANFRQERGDAPGALAAQERALAGAPEEHADAIRFPYAMMLIDAGRLAEARALGEEIATPALTDLLDGRLLLAKGDAAGALEAFERGVARNPADARGHYLIGLAAQALGRLDRALSAYAAAFERDPGATDAALAAARLHFALGEHGSSATAAPAERAGAKPSCWRHAPTPPSGRRPWRPRRSSVGSA